MVAYIALFSALLSRLTALTCGSTWVTSFIARILNIHRSGVLTVLAWLVPHETAAVSAQVLCIPYNHAPCHFMQSHIRKVYACLGCNLTPALLAEWPGSFTCYCGNTGVERILKYQDGGGRIWGRRLWGWRIWGRSRGGGGGGGFEEEGWGWRILRKKAGVEDFEEEGWGEEGIWGRRLRAGRNLRKKDGERKEIEEEGCGQEGFGGRRKGRGRNSRKKDGGRKDGGGKNFEEEGAGRKDFEIDGLGKEAFWGRGIKVLSWCLAIHDLLL